MLARKYKLKRDNDFKKVFNQGQYYQEEFIKLKVLNNDLTISRFAFIVGLKISKKAVERNKIKRQLEEIIQQSFDQIRPGFDVIVLPNLAIIGQDYQSIEKTLISLFKKTKIWIQ